MADDTMRDQELDVPSSEIMSHDELGEPTSDGNALLAALGGGTSDEEFVDDGSSPKASGWLTPRTAIIAGILVGGGGMIYGMREYEIKQGMDMEPLISMSVLDVSTTQTPLTPKEEAVLASLRQSVSPLRPAPDLSRNPLELEGHETEVVVEETHEPIGPDINALTLGYTKIFESLHLSSVILSGGVPVAVVNHTAVKVGGVVGDIFIVREIAKDSHYNTMYVKVELVGYDPAVDGAQLNLYLNSGR